MNGSETTVLCTDFRIDTRTEDNVWLGGADPAAQYSPYTGAPSLEEEQNTDADKEVYRRGNRVPQSVTGISSLHFYSHARLDIGPFPPAAITGDPEKKQSLPTSQVSRPMGREGSGSPQKWEMQLSAGAIPCRESGTLACRPR
ncbi:hypothetical protein N7462_008905 [Penicillium macrosclerotiorum]|uniref:uncharacterized protein n=1 Tax=Penicillium macrosclerotiorum TaxID=303699 RepID=UPI002548C1B9|nr:uncharacterized protein N7462_008905 [Penicillium macrosclerotiorum]KAJ5676008.1 hypothetical protein N7462_008905 [Penicillium macrosclerotiorum]